MEKNKPRLAYIKLLTPNVNLNRFGPYVHFYPSKTMERKRQECYLECIDNDMLEYFDGLPAKCDYLFPRIVNGEYTDLGDFKNHWHTMLKESHIENFRWHDLKHCAITYMIDIK